jgi:hypothetical protein
MYLGSSLLTCECVLLTESTANPLSCAGASRPRLAWLNTQVRLNERVTKWQAVQYEVARDGIIGFWAPMHLSWLRLDAPQLA